MTLIVHVSVTITEPDCTCVRYCCCLLMLQVVTVKGASLITRSSWGGGVPAAHNSKTINENEI